MFTDEPTTPLRVETLLQLMRGLGRRVGRETLGAVVQPEGLPDKRGETASRTIRAALELKLLRENDDGTMSTTSEDKRPVREAVLEALDREVLAHTRVEPYFALF